MSTTTANLTDLLDVHAAALVAEGHAPGVVAVAVNGRDQVLACYGHPSRDVQPLDGQTLFEIGSLTKTFTGLLLAQMVKSAQVRYDDPIIAYLPAHAAPQRPEAGQITLLQLATHTAGLPRLPPNLNWQNAPSDPYSDYHLGDLYHATANLDLCPVPAATVSYSTFGVGLLAQLLVNAANRPYGQLLAERICRPLGLTATTTQPSADDTARLATGHECGMPVAPWRFDALVGSGGLHTTGKDLMAYLQAHLHPESSPLAEALAATHAPRCPNGKNAICLIWNHRIIDERALLWHTGGTGGFSAFMGFSPDTVGGVGLLTNTKTTSDQAVLRAGRRLFKRAVFPHDC